ncbi:hypothetical protein Amet_1508 [Alkaliphilus metalliredigens QYMF]|uniref:Uncharacterized protein n=1 Tax=Alkaliphilus metalliredigens (strain QYMF) TaxID=293826 RepID=A6TND4_ALKMQ|nr:hypothetical protein Amet_1508 [Alkaliphilus metalliredigens QYMF]
MIEVLRRQLECFRYFSASTENILLRIKFLSENSDLFDFIVGTDLKDIDENYNANNLIIN